MMRCRFGEYEMPLSNDLQATVHQFIKTKWTRTESRTVPTPEQLQMGNHAVELREATCLYADLVDSTQMVSTCGVEFSATVYKCFLHCATKLVLAEGGTVTSFDGDRVMAIFVGPDRQNAAVRAALQINTINGEVIEPALRNQWRDTSSRSFQLRHTVGIDSSPVFATRTGVRGDNDIVWVGRAPNFAAKLASCRIPDAVTLITADVFGGLSGEARGVYGTSMWGDGRWRREYRSIDGITGVALYSSSARLKPTR